MSEKLTNTERSTPTLPFSPDLETRAMDINRWLRRCGDTTATTMVETLNWDAAALGVIGKEVIVNSDVLVQTRYEFDAESGQFQLASAVDNSTEEGIRGIFDGFEQYAYDDERMLTYRLVMPVEGGDLAYDVVNASVADATIAEIDKEAEREEEARQGVLRAIERIADVPDDAFQSLALAFLITIHDINGNERLSAPLLAEFSEQIIELINHPVIAEDKDVKLAITEVITTMFDSSEVYHLQGHSLSYAWNNGETQIHFNDHITAWGYVKGVRMVDNYEYTLGSPPVLDERAMQPALAVSSADGFDLFLPFRFLAVFNEAEIRDMSCDGSLGRFRGMFFKPQNDQ